MLNDISQNLTRMGSVLTETGLSTFNSHGAQSTRIHARKKFL